MYHRITIIDIRGVNRMKQYFIIIVFMVSVVGNLVSFGAQSETALDVIELSFDISSSHVSVETNRTGDTYEMSFQSQENGAYLYVSQVLQDDWSDESGLCIDLENDSDADLEIKLHLMDASWRDITIAEGTGVFLQNGGETEYHCVLVSDGFFVLPAGFDGTVTIFFDGLCFSESKNIVTSSVLSDVRGLSFTLVPGALAHHRLELSQLSFLGNEVIEVAEMYQDIRIVCDDEMLAPLEGERIMQILVQGKENVESSYRLAQEYEGIEVTKDGLLSISAAARTEEIRLEVVLNQQLVIEKVISLEYNWTQWYTSQDGEKYYIEPSTNHQGNRDLLILETMKTYLIPIRLIGCFIGIFLFVIYQFWKRKNKIRANT